MEARYAIRAKVSDADWRQHGWPYAELEACCADSEVFHNTSAAIGEKSSAGFNLGGFYNFDEQNHLLFSAGCGLQNASQTNRASGYLGYQYTL